MATSPSSCLSSEILENIAAGQPVADEAQAHLDTCSVCRSALARIRDDNQFLMEFAVDGALPGASTTEPSATIDIPGYEITREIHRGGQGVVYLAVQRATRRDCAVKVMKHGPFATSADRSRFDREVATLSMLDHPNIVAVRDAGTVAGFQYFVMDYVDGRALDEAFDCADSERAEAAPPDVDGLLHVFIKVCDAVHAAHLRGVIHRDLKPSNVRVDRLGEPRVLDFGLAKPTDSQTDAAMTQTGVFVGSLPWASPEQVEGVSAQVDLRTDVYSLGAVLFQLLTGRTPFDVGSNLHDALNDILFRPAPRPSEVAPSETRACIGDELDTIVLKCLAKDRNERYQSAGDLARDLRRFLNGEPIEAKRDSALYVLRKTLQRYRMRVAGAVATLVVLAVFSFFMVVLYRQTARLKQDAIRSAESLAVLLTQSNLEQGRMAGVLGNLDQAEHLLWREFLTHHASVGDGMLHLNDPPGPIEANWALWELYRRFPCRRTLNPESGVFQSATMALDGQSVWAVESTGAVRRFDADGVILDAFSVQPSDAPAWSVVTAQGESVVELSNMRLTLRSRGGEGGERDALVTREQVSAISVAPGGRRAAFLTQGAAVVWDLASGEDVARFQPEGVELSAVAISPDAETVAARGPHGNVYLWNVETRQRTRLDNLVSLPEDLHPLGDLQFSRDGRYLADAWMDTPGRIWDLEAAPPTAVLLSESPGDQRVQAFSSDGRLLAIGDLGGSLRLFDVMTGQMRRSFVAHAGRVLRVGFTADDRQVWSCSERELRFWDVALDGAVRTVRIDRDGLHGVAIDPDATWLATGGGLGVLHRIDLATLSLSSESFGNVGTISSVAVSADGRYTAVSSYADAVYIWDGTRPGTLPALLPHPYRVSCVCFSHDGALLATAGDDRKVRIWRSDDHTLWHKFDTNDRIPQLAFDPSDRQLAAALRDGSLLVWDIGSGACEEWLSPNDRPLRSVCFSPDGDWLAAAGADRKVSLWSTATHRKIAELAGHNQEIFCLCISPDGEQIASGDTGGVVRLWDVPSRQALATLDGHRGAVMAVQFTRDRQTLASVSLDTTIRIWDLNFYRRHIQGNLEAHLRSLRGDELDAAKSSAWREWSQ